MSVFGCLQVVPCLGPPIFTPVSLGFLSPAPLQGPTLGGVGVGWHLGIDRKPCPYRRISNNDEPTIASLPRYGQSLTGKGGRSTAMWSARFLVSPFRVADSEDVPL
jgi:hypothetical protein